MSVAVSLLALVAVVWLVVWLSSKAPWAHVNNDPDAQADRDANFPEYPGAYDHLIQKKGFGSLLKGGGLSHGYDEHGDLADLRKRTKAS